IQAMDLEPEICDYEELSKEYQRLGFKKERNLYALKKDGSLKAIIMVSVSDIGLNMSDLTNCIKVVVLDQDGFSCDILYSMLSTFSAKYVQQKIPVLLYPVNCAENQSISYEKIYNMWILSMEHTDHYFRHLKRLLKRV
ncbi:MAG: PilZ domain-containing protein, partial [Deltaproteobacteria bacterium]|nr:PilZ domain-containing protein [Deltaproteobacteria bacterium]